MIKTLLNRPLTVLTVFSLLVIMGVFLISGLPVDLMPDMSPPFIYVATPYPAAGPEEVEQDVTNILEDQLYTLEGLKSMTSTSSEGSSGILLEFSWGDDTEAIKQDVRDKLDLLSNSLPEDALEPQIFEYDPNSSPILVYSLQGERDVEELYALADEELKPRMEQVTDISKVEITGGRDKLVRVSLSADRLEAYGLSLTKISNVIALQNFSLGAGSVDTAGKEFLVRTSGEYASLEELKNTVITSLSSQGEIHKVYLRDVADVYYDYEEADSEVLIDGSPSVRVSAFKKSGANTVSVAKDIREAAQEAEPLLPAGVELVLVEDTSKVINQSLSSVLQAAVVGVFCSILVLLIFLRQARSTLIVAISIPVSLMITILAMSLGGKTFNVVALTGLTLGVGMVVDSSIVILENIFSHREQGERLAAASLFGTQEMVTPIIASTLTTISVFLPIIIFGGEIGAMGAVMGDLAFTVIAALSASLFVAVFLVPVLSSHFLKIHTREERPLENPLLKKVDALLEGAVQLITRGYRRLLATALAHRFFTLGASALLLIIALGQTGKMGLDFMPPQPSTSLSLLVELPLGSSLDTTRETMEQLEMLAREELTSYDTITRVSGDGASHKGRLTIALPDLAERSQDEEEMKEALRRLFDLFPDVTFSFAAGGTPMSSAGFTLTVRGDDLDELIRYSASVKSLIEKDVPEIKEAGLDVNDGLPQWDIVLDRERCSDLGLQIQMVAAEVRALLAGSTATELTDQEGETLDVVIQLRDEDKEGIPDLKNLFVLNGRGQKISLDNVARIEVNQGPEGISHSQEKRAVTLTGDLAPGQASNFVENKVRTLVEETLTPPEGLSLDFGGDMDDIRESGSGLLLILAFAVLLVFGVMISQFESLKAPFIVLLSMPMLAIGVIGIYLIMGQTFSMISLIGVVMLSGIVVNNGIVLVDYISLLRKRGGSTLEACLEGGASRLRPILMTTLTTILSMVPLAFFSGEGGESMQPLAVTVVGGLTVNTIIALVMIPVLYSVMFRDKGGSRVSN